MGDKKVDQGALHNENIAYTITSGFYPELAAGLKFGGSKTKTVGATSAKYFKKRGFDSSSIRRLQHQLRNQGKEGFTKEGIPLAFRRNKPGQKKFLTDADKKAGNINPDFWSEGSLTGSAYMKRTEASKTMGSFFKKNQRVGKLWSGDEGGKAFNEDDTGLMAEAAAAGEQLEKVSYSKWMGGSELYKLYGTKVWFMEGNRANKQEISDELAGWANAISRSETDALPENYLNQIYSRSEDPKLIGIARKMAKEVFGKALDKSNLNEDLQSVGRGRADVAEEDVKEAKNLMKRGRKRYARSSNLKVDKESHAQKLDAMTRDLDNQHDVYLDSTEMGIATDKGHGIISASVQVKNAIKKLDDPDDPASIHALEQAVAKMFMKNIDLDYNPIIRKLKEFMGKGEDQEIKNQATKFKKLLNRVKEARTELNSRKTWSQKGKLEKKMGKTKGKTHISVVNLAAAAGFELGKSMTLHTGGRTARTEAMKYVVHMLANLGDGQQRLFRQGHRVATWTPGGHSTYVSVPMGIIPGGEPDELLFYGTGTSPPAKKGTDNSPLDTVALTGESHLLAWAVKAKAISKEKAAEAAKLQAQAHARARIHPKNAWKLQSTSQVAARYDIKRKCLGSTRVTFNPKALGAKIEAVMRYFYADDGKAKLTKGKKIKTALPFIEDQMKKYIHAWPNQSWTQGKPMRQGGQQLSRTGMMDKNRFWALPYIGIHDNIYRGGKFGGPGVKALPDKK